MSITALSAPELQFLACRARVLAGGEPGASLGIVEMLEMPAGDMPPLHVHHQEDEGFYVLEGEITIFHPGEAVILRAGEFAMTPRGVPHVYRVGDVPARALVTSAPGGFERFVTAVAALDELSPAILTAVAAEHGIEILGPPGMLP